MTDCAQLTAHLEQMFWPELGMTLGEAGVPVTVSVQGDGFRVGICLGYPHEGAHAAYVARVQGHCAGESVTVALSSNIAAHANQSGMAALDQVSNIIAVSSGKGGVGKSTTAVNLALALQAEGARVGVLDADVFGPSLPTMLGVAAGTRPDVIDGKAFVPVEAHGLQTMSMGYLVDEQSPVVWRGPKASGALQQLVAQTRWHALDYLLVDMPPGTGDIQLTLAQRVPVAGAVVVTTPQDIALLDAIKGIEMFRKVGVSVVGVVENMSVHVCGQCGHVDALFGDGGGERIANDYEVPLLGKLPLNREIRECADGGTPLVAARADSELAALYRDCARMMAARLSLRPPATRAFPAVNTIS